MVDALQFLVSKDDDGFATSAPDAAQLHLSKKLDEYPEQAYRKVHKVSLIVPVSVAGVLRHSIYSEAIKLKETILTPLFSYIKCNVPVNLHSYV